MVTGIETKQTLVTQKQPADRRPLFAVWFFALGLAVAIAAATLWTMSMFNHDDGKDVAVLLLVSLASFGLGAHLMDCFECGRRN
jgi:hypothetical protein